MQGSRLTQPARSAVVVPIALPAALEAIRLRHVENARLGVPSHVTLLFPFVPAGQLASADIDRAAAAVGEMPAFAVSFREARSFDATPSNQAVVWLAPEPADPFVAATNALAEAFPAYPPYEGIHDTVIPHLTLANVDVDAPSLIETTRLHLPFTRRVAAAAVLVEDDAGQWRIARELPLA